jgi:hypothetical protein
MERHHLDSIIDGVSGTRAPDYAEEGSYWDIDLGNPRRSVYRHRMGNRLSGSSIGLRGRIIHLDPRSIGSEYTQVDVIYSSEYPPHKNHMDGAE